MKTLASLVTGMVAIILLTAPVAWSHCEIPCGIYDDSVRVTLMREDITTIEKSMDEINKLSAEGDKNYNQLVRWITNKEAHADKLMGIVTQYFMTQRIKPATADNAQAYEKYQEEISLLHQMLVSAMKCKQTTDKAHTAKLRELVDKFAASYFDHTH
ncbi:MAG: superoxide dismutase [Ni] [Candidatus Zixiibacteriota bacterium]